MDPIPNGDIYLQPLNMNEASTNDTKNKELAEKIYEMISKGGEKHE
ncbi:hypothetical protein [Clostridium sp. DMHC 10]|nr:hypothetical protein [Clostridium sp. DMHC 10]